MKRRLSAALAALVLTAALAACQGDEPVPEKSAAPEEPSASSQEAEAPPPAEEAEESPLLSVREYDIPRGFDCAGISGDKAIILNRTLAECSSSFDEGNMVELDLNSGETRKLGIWADLGMIQADGDTFYWVGMDEEPRYPGPFPEYVQAGIFKGDRDGNGELVYRLSSWEDGQWKWKITQLAMGDSVLVWLESWKFKDGGQGPDYHQRLQTMDLETGKVATVAEWDAHQYYHQLRVKDNRLIYWESIRNEETSLHLYDLSAGEELLVLPVKAVSDADCSGDRLVWCPWNVPTLHIYDMASGESTTCSIPEKADRVKLCGENYLLYSTDNIGIRLSVRLLDLDTGEVVKERIEDSRQNRKKAQQVDIAVFDNDRNQAAYTTWFGEDETTLTVIRFLGES